MQQLLIQQHCRQHQLGRGLRNIIGLNKLRQIHLTHIIEEGMEFFRLNAMHQLLLIETQHPQQQLRFCTGEDKVLHPLITQLIAHRPDGAAQKFGQRLVEVHALATVALKAFLRADNADMEVLLISDFLVAHQRHAQAAGGNIHHQHALTLAGKLFVFQRIADSDILRIDFHRHIDNVDNEPCLVINLVQQENLVASLTHSSRSLHLVLFYPIFLHQQLEALQNLADFRNKLEGNDFVFKGCLT